LQFVSNRANSRFKTHEGGGETGGLIARNGASQNDNASVAQFEVDVRKVRATACNSRKLRLDRRIHRRGWTGTVIEGNLRANANLSLRFRVIPLTVSDGVDILILIATASPQSILPETIIAAAKSGLSETIRVSLCIAILTVHTLLLSVGPGRPECVSRRLPSGKVVAGLHAATGAKLIISEGSPRIPKTSKRVVTAERRAVGPIGADTACRRLAERTVGTEERSPLCEARNRRTGQQARCEETSKDFRHRHFSERFGLPEAKSDSEFVPSWIFKPEARG